MSKTFLVTIPEIREEYVPVVYEVKAESIEAVQDLLDSRDFMDLAQYKESLESPWGFEVRDYDYDKAEIVEATNG
jgi:hypothetical protein